MYKASDWLKITCFCVKICWELKEISNASTIGSIFKSITSVQTVTNVVRCGHCTAPTYKNQ